MSEVKTNDTVKVHYTGKLNNGDVFDSSLQREPLEFKVGAGSMIPGFENAVMGMKNDESKTVKIPSGEAYGALNKDLIFEVNNDRLPKELKPELGMELISKMEDGREMRLRIHEIHDDHVVLNANHPLAGEDLTFEIKVVEVS